MVYVSRPQGERSVVAGGPRRAVAQPVGAGGGVRSVGVRPVAWRLLLAHAPNLTQNDLIRRTHPRSRHYHPETLQPAVPPENRFGRFVPGGRQGFLDASTWPSRRATLIPRADSETLIRAALAAFPVPPRVASILDLGTGTELLCCWTVACRISPRPAWGRRRLDRLAWRAVAPCQAGNAAHIGNGYSRYRGLHIRVRPLGRGGRRDVRSDPVPIPLTSAHRTLPGLMPEVDRNTNRAPRWMAAPMGWTPIGPSRQTCRACWRGAVRRSWSLGRVRRRRFRK